MEMVPYKSAVARGDGTHFFSSRCSESDGVLRELMENDN